MAFAWLHLALPTPRRQSNMAFSVPTPISADKGAEDKIAAAYATDPGATPGFSDATAGIVQGQYINTTAGITAADALGPQGLRLMVVGNHHDCAAPIPDFDPAIGHELRHPWEIATSANIGDGPDVMGGESGGFSATCYYYGIELMQRLKKPIGLIHSSYGGTAVEDWIPKDILGACY